MNDRKLIKKSDIIVICFIAVLAAACAFIGSRGKPEATVCHVLYDGHIVETRSLGKDASFRIKEAPGMVFEIKDGKAAVGYSDCPDKVCVKSGLIGHTGQKSVCLPNRVVVSIDGGFVGADEPDAIAR